MGKKRNPRKTRWTKAWRKSSGKELAVDSTFEFEKRRHEPVKYDRELWQKSIEAMKIVSAIREKRETHFIMKRLEQGVRDRKSADLHEVKTNLNMVMAPGAKGFQKLIERAGGKKAKETVEIHDEMDHEVPDKSFSMEEANKNKTPAMELEMEM